jgi:hypothetical protein
MIPKFVEAAVAELKAMWPEGEHFPTLSWNGYKFNLRGKKHNYRSGYCPLALYNEEIKERINAFNRESEDDYFLPTSPWDKLLKWYNPDYHRITVSFEVIAKAEADYSSSEYFKSRKLNESGC